MAYVSPAQIEAMKTAGVPAALKDGKYLIPLSPNQMALLLGLYNMVKGDNNEESPWDVAYAKFRELYHVDEGLWVATELPPETVPVQPVQAAAEPAKKLAEAQLYHTKPKVLFGPGRWASETGWVEKTDADCREMVQNFHELKDRVFVTNKIDHDDEQRGVEQIGALRDLSGEPMVGYVEDVWWDPAGNVVMGRLAVPEEVAQSIDRHELKKVSIEFDDRWWDGAEERRRDNVLKHAALLGVRWPAYTNQPDSLEIERSVMAADGGSGAIRYCLSLADAEPQRALSEGGGEDVEKLEELKTRITELEAENAELKAAQPDEEKDALRAEVAELKEKLALSDQAKAAADEKIADAELVAKEATVDAAIAELTTADKKGDVRMLPKEAVVEKARLMAADDSKTIKLAEGGGEVEKSEFELGIEALKLRPVVLKLAEQGVDDSDPLHKGKPKDELPPETPQEKEAREGMGYVRQADGSWASPKDKE